MDIASIIMGASIASVAWIAFWPWAQLKRLREIEAGAGAGPGTDRHRVRSRTARSRSMAGCTEMGTSTLAVWGVRQWLTRSSENTGSSLGDAPRDTHVTSRK